MTPSGLIQLVLATLLLLASAYGLLWTISSSHMAHEACGGQFSLFHEHFRCRQPQLGILLFVAAGLPSAAMYLVRWRRWRRDRR
jgi:hypothetical protein